MMGMVKRYGLNGEDVDYTMAMEWFCRSAEKNYAPAQNDIGELFEQGLGVNRDMAKALILDAAASAAVENVCDNLCADLAEALAPQYLTDRFSPGYGDLPLSQQKELFRLLDVTRRIGVSLSESGLMVPQKSVTALIGVSDHPQPKRSRGCETCTMFADCAYRKDGKNCGKP